MNVKLSNAPSCIGLKGLLQYNSCDLLNTFSVYPPAMNTENQDTYWMLIHVRKEMERCIRRIDVRIELVNIIMSHAIVGQKKESGPTAYKGGMRYTRLL